MLTSSSTSIRYTAAPAARAPWIMLFGRMGLFLLVQALFALGFFLAGKPDAWIESTAWWPLTVTIGNLAILAVLINLYRAEGKRYWDIFKIKREHIKGDLLVLLGFMLIAGPAGMFPNIWLAEWLYGDSQAVLDLFVRPLPMWAAYAGSFLFAITQGLVEIPMYFLYVMPRLKTLGVQRWLAVALPVMMLGFQHMVVPLRFDARFITWRALMFLPFALVVGLILNWRPRLLPYIAIVHFLIDFAMAPMFLAVAF